jgi:hypothetical protein
MMFNLGRPRPARAGRALRLAAWRAVERLEDRRLMSGTAQHHDDAGPEAASFADFNVSPQAATSASTATVAASGAKYSLSKVPALSSRPGAPATLYLDFNGDTTTAWGAYSPGKTPAMNADGDPATFSDGELDTIRGAWARVAEDFAPFDLNVTTVDPGSYKNHKATRVVVGGKSDWYGSPVAGLSYVGAFSNDQPNTSFVFVNGDNAGYMADIISHEAGHSFGLGHQEVYGAGGAPADAYADGDVTSTPLMGGGGGRSVWWRGDSGGPGLTQDDADVIAGPTNGFGYRADDHGNTSFLPTALTLRAADGAWVGSGVIETLADRDWFGFTLATGGDTIVTVNSADPGPNLDSKVELRNLAGGLVASYDAADLGESFALNLSAGAYRVGVMSHGRVGDLGQYTVSVIQPNVPRPRTPFGTTPVPIASSGATTIQAENFDRGGEGVAYHDLDAANTGGVSRAAEGVDLKSATDSGGGYRLSDARAGEWVEYTVNVAKAGPYTLGLRVSNSRSGGTLHFEANGANVSGSLPVPNTGSFNTFKTISAPVTLAAGRQVLRVAFDALPSGGDSVAGLNWLRLAPVTPPGTGTVLPSAALRVASATAAYVREGTTAKTNYGSDSKLAVKGSTGGASRESYLKFDLAAIPATLTSATLRLYGSLSAALGGGLGVQVFAGATNSWDENAITWNKRPGSSAGTLAQFTVSGAAPAWYEVDVTACLKAQKAAGKSSVTLVLKGAGSTTPYAQFSSDEAGSNGPELLIAG